MPAKEWFEKYAKIGYTSKGIIYILSGVLTGLAALGIGGQKASNTDVFKKIENLPAGSLLLVILAIGLIGYSLWRLAQALLDTESKGTSLKGIGKRVAYTFSGLIYGSLAILAFNMGIGNSNGDSGTSKAQVLVTELLQKPFGKWIAVVVGLITIGNGLYQIKKAITKSFLKHLQKLPPDQYQIISKSGQAGYAARGVIFGIIGFLFVKAAWYHNPSKADGTEGAFTFLQTSPFGNWLLAAVSLGLICYGIFMMVMAKYSRISVD